MVYTILIVSRMDSLKNIAFSNTNTFCSCFKQKNKLRNTIHIPYPNKMVCYNKQ